jgi:Cft2 family RNA processing exonuclease
MTSLRRLSKRQNPDPLRANINKREDNELRDSIPNDAIEAVVIFLALVGMISAGIALYYLSQQV